MAGSLDEFLDLAVKQKQALDEAASRRQAESAAAIDKMTAARAKVEQQTQDLWDGVKAQMDSSIEVINGRSEAIDLTAEVEERFGVGPFLALRAVHFVRRTGFGQISLYIQVSRLGMMEYRLDKKVLFKGKISQLKPKDHEAVMTKSLAFAVARLITGEARAKQTEGSRAQIWGTAKAS